jgi:hypothetical protein
LVSRPCNDFNPAYIDITRVNLKTCCFICST